MIIPITIFITDILLAWFCFWIGKQTVKPIKEDNVKLLQEKKRLTDECKNLNQERENILQDFNFDKEQFYQLKLKRKDLDNQIIKIENEIKLQQESATNAAQALYQNQVIQMNSFFEQDREKLENDYKLLNEKNELIKQNIKDNEKQLKSLQETRAAAITAAQKEKIISENKDNYCLMLLPQDQGDIEILRNIIKKISKPRSILMAIWQAYYQPIAKKTFPKILGKTDVCGIYKITNQETGECYIGQAVDVRRRWMDHCKAGLGIDTPQGNQLYQAMQEYGLDSFSFELLLECEPSQLNEKEKYFIQLYNSDAIGYNRNKGVN